jgi:hypothetical protein
VDFRIFRNFRYRYPSTGLEVSEVCEVSEGRRETLVGLVVGVSAVSASDTPIASSSARRPDPGTREYFRTAIGPQNEFPPVSAGFLPLRDIAGRARICGGFEVSALSAAHLAAVDAPAAVRARRTVDGHRSRRACWRVDADEHHADLSRRRSAGISHNIAQERQEQRVTGNQNNTFAPA